MGGMMVDCFALHILCPSREPLQESLQWHHTRACALIDGPLVIDFLWML